MKMSISKKSFYLSISIFFFLIIFLRIDSFFYILPYSITIIYKYSIIPLIGVLLFLILSRKHMSAETKLILLYSFVFIISSSFNSEARLVTAIGWLAGPVGIALLIEYYGRKNKYLLLKVIVFTLTALIILDLLSIMKYPNGLYTTLYRENWILGYKSARGRIATIPVIAFAACMDSMTVNKRLSMKFYLIAIVAILDTFLSGGTGATVFVVIETFIIAYISLKKNEKKSIINQNKLLNIGLIITIVLNIVFVLLQTYSNNRIVKYIVVDLLGKDLTFTGRTGIWKSSFELFKQSWMYGWGFINGDNFATITGAAAGTQPHNLFLSVMVYTGCIGLLIFLVLLIKTMNKYKYIKFDIVTISFVCIFVNLLWGIISSAFNGQFFLPMFTFISICGDSTRDRI